MNSITNDEYLARSLACLPDLAEFDYHLWRAAEAIEDVASRAMGARWEPDGDWRLYVAHRMLTLAHSDTPIPQFYDDNGPIPSPRMLFGAAGLHNVEYQERNSTDKWAPGYAECCTAWDAYCTALSVAVRNLLTGDGPYEFASALNPITYLGNSAARYVAPAPIDPHQQ